MRARFGAAAIAAALLAAPVMPAGAQDAVQFTVVDHLSPGQLEETITVYVGARSVGTLHVDLTRNEDRISVSVPRAASYEYTLCGRLRMQAGAGATEREVNDGGTLTEAEGRTFAVYTDGGALFYLLDVSSGQRPAEVRRDDARRCAAAIASR